MADKLFAATKAAEAMATPKTTQDSLLAGSSSVISSAMTTNPFMSAQANPYMNYSDQLAFACSNLLFNQCLNQAVLSATAAFNQNGLVENDVKKTLVDGNFNPSTSNMSLNDMFQLPNVPSDLFHILPSNENTHLNLNAGRLDGLGLGLLADNAKTDSESDSLPYLGKSRRRRHPRRKIPPPPEAVEVQKTDGAIIRHCTNCGVIGHDRRNCQKPRFDKSGGVVKFTRKCSVCGLRGHDRRLCPKLSKDDLSNLNASMNASMRTLNPGEEAMGMASALDPHRPGDALLLNSIKQAEQPFKKIKLDHSPAHVSQMPALELGSLLPTDTENAVKKLQQIMSAPLSDTTSLSTHNIHNVPPPKIPALSRLPTVVSSLPQSIPSISSIRNSMTSSTPSSSVNISDPTNIMLAQQLFGGVGDATDSMATSDQIASLMQFIRNGGDDASPAASALFNASTVHVDLLDGNGGTSVSRQPGLGANSMLGLSLSNGTINNPLFDGTTVDLLDKHTGPLGQNGISMLGLNIDNFTPHGMSMLGLNLELNEEAAQHQNQHRSSAA